MTATRSAVPRVLAAVVAGASVGLALVEGALVLDFALAECPTSPGAQSNTSYLLSALVLCLVPAGGLVGGLLWRRLPLLAWIGLAAVAWAALFALYRILDWVLNGGTLSPCCRDYVPLSARGTREG
jgi:hypothetical protein